MVEEKLNPWFSMWLQPKKTIKAVVSTNPRMGFFFLAAIWFLQLFFFLDSYYPIKIPIHWGLVVIIAVVLSPILGAVYFYFISWYFYIIGKLLKGKAKMSHVVSSFAWSRLPFIVNLIIWFSISIFLSDQSYAKIGLNIFVFANLVTLTTAIWSFILLVKALEEVQKFSLFKSLLTVIITYCVSLIAFLFVSSIIYLIIC